MCTAQEARAKIKVKRLQAEHRMTYLFLRSSRTEPRAGKKNKKNNNKPQEQDNMNGGEKRNTGGKKHNRNLDRQSDLKT